MDEAVGKHILTEKIKRKALELGFARVGVTTADDIDGYEDAVLAAPKTKNPYLEWLSSEFSLEKLLFCDEDYYDACVRPIMFNYIHDIDIFRQNAAIAMGNSGDASYLPALRRALEEGSEQVRRFAKHAIEQLSAQPSTAP